MLFFDFGIVFGFLLLFSQLLLLFSIFLLLFSLVLLLLSRFTGV